MIQSGKFDSLKMNIKKLANTILFFTIKRLIEILGILISFIGIFYLFLSLPILLMIQILYFQKTLKLKIY